MSLRSAVWHPATWVALTGVLLLGMSAAVLRMKGQATSAAPEDYGAIAPFSLVDQTGASVTDQDLRGTTWLGDFIFTSCPDACPALTATMSGLIPRLPSEGVRLVSFTVDPTTDTPERLRAWSATWNPDPRRWSFLTGTPDAVASALAGLKVAATRVTGPDGALSLVHSEKILLVDGRGHLRGFYGLGKDELDALVADSAAVADEHRAPAVSGIAERATLPP